jgi:oligoendopeptidase F
MIELPASPDAFTNATWGDVAPFYDALAAAPLSLDTVEAWLSDWSRLEELVGEAGTVAMVEYTCDTGNPAKEDANLRFSTEIFPKADEQQVRLAGRLLDLGYSRDDLETMLEEFRTDARIFREANVALFAEVEELAARYQKIVGALGVEWEGERITVPQLQPHLMSPDRSVRERAFHLGAAAYLAERDKLNDTFDRMYALRQDAARNAGFADLEEFSYAAKHRFDYTPADVARFRDAVEQAVVPAVERIHARRRERLGLATLRPWDLGVDPDHREPLRPFTDAADFLATSRRVFRAVDPELGREFDLMADAGLLDLESRPGKAPGGYCTKLAFRRLPFIFMNAVGVADDVNTLVHEAGHCFHAFAARDLPFVWQRSTGSEAAELASMAMELLAAPYLAQPVGFYTPPDARRAQIEHLEDVVHSLVHIASVDAFQSWIYTSGDGHSRDARDRAWLDIRGRFERGVDWSGLEDERIARWLRQLHIFELPFYYVEYGIAQLGAVQVWRNSLTDHGAAVAAYRRALALGGTRSLPDIYRAAGAELVFDAPRIAELVGVVESRLAELYAEDEAATTVGAR